MRKERERKRKEGINKQTNRGMKEELNKRRKYEKKGKRRKE